MKFANTTFVVRTRVTAGSDPINTTISLSESEIADDVVANALTAGNSPRVAWQNRARTNGVPQEETLAWADWIGRPARAAKPMSSEEALAMVMAHPGMRARLMEQMLAEAEIAKRNATTPVENTKPP